MACYGAAYIHYAVATSLLVLWMGWDGEELARVVEDATWKEVWGERLYILALTLTMCSVLVFGFMFYSFVLPFPLSSPRPCLFLIFFHRT